jgi:hypothetical protein
MASLYPTQDMELPAELAVLDWDAVRAFWSDAQRHDGRRQAVRDYLAMGAALERTKTPVALSQEQVHAAYAEGDDALEERLTYFMRHAEARLDQVQRMDDQRRVLVHDMEEKEEAIHTLSAAADARLELVERLNDQLAAAWPRGEAETRVTVLEEEVSRHESALLDVAEGVRALQSAVSEQTTLLTRIAARYEPESSDRQLEPPEVKALRRERDYAQAAADARLVVIEEQKKAIDALQRSRLKHRMRQVLAPRIGVLYQYDPRPMEVPPSYARRKPPEPAPTISIVTPSLNQGAFIERTIKSVVQQGYPKLEYIIQDGMSGDDTVEVLDRYREKLTSIASEKDDGFADAINRGFSKATGEILAYLNSDDLLLPGALNYVGEYFARHADVDVVYGHRIVIDEYDSEIGRWVLPAHDDAALSWADYVPQETMFWRRTIWEKVGGGVDESFRFAIDWDLLLRFRDAGAKFERLPRFLGAFRVHPHQKTSAEMAENGVREMGILRERAVGHRVTADEIDRGLRPYLRQHFILHKLYRAGVLRY